MMLFRVLSIPHRKKSAYAKQEDLFTLWYESNDITAWGSTGPNCPSWPLVRLYFWAMLCPGPLLLPGEVSLPSSWLTLSPRKLFRVVPTQVLVMYLIRPTWVCAHTRTCPCSQENGVHWLVSPRSHGPHRCWELGSVTSIAHWQMIGVLFPKRSSSLTSIKPRNIIYVVCMKLKFWSQG